MVNKKWSTTEETKLRSIVADSGTNWEGFKKAAKVLDRSTQACSFHYYKVMKPKAKLTSIIRTVRTPTTAPFTLIDNKPILKVPGSKQSAPITIHSGGAKIVISNGKITISTQ